MPKGIYKRTPLSYYGGTPPKCACCGEGYLEFLAIDHVNGNGNRLRKEKKCGSGSRLYTWIIKNNFPQDLRVLYHNCNCALGLQIQVIPMIITNPNKLT